MIRCDLCNSTQDVVWTWITPSIAASVEEAKANKTFWAEDPEWAVCDTCHVLILVDDQEAVFQRAMDNQTLVAITDELTVLRGGEHVRDVHNMFFKFKDSYRRD